MFSLIVILRISPAATSIKSPTQSSSHRELSVTSAAVVEASKVPISWHRKTRSLMQKRTQQVSQVEEFTMTTLELRAATAMVSTRHQIVALDGIQHQKPIPTRKKHNLPPTVTMIHHTPLPSTTQTTQRCNMIPALQRTIRTPLEAYLHGMQIRPTSTSNHIPTDTRIEHTRHRGHPQGDRDHRTIVAADREIEITGRRTRGARAR